MDLPLGRHHTGDIHLRGAEQQPQPHFDMLYDPIDILTWCEEHKVIHFFNGEQERVEGKGHTGLADVIQVVIRKLI